VASCPSCKREYAIYASIQSAGRELPDEPISDDFNTRLLNRIAEERFAETRTKAYQPKAAPLFAWTRLATVVATACLAVFAVVSLLPEGDITSPIMTANNSQSVTDSGSLDNSYLTVEPVTNPNMTVPMEKDWSLDRQLARAERVKEISNSIIPVGSFGGPQYQLSSRNLLTGQPVPYLLNQYRMRPVVKIYVLPQSIRLEEGNKPY